MAHQGLRLQLCAYTWKTVVLINSTRARQKMPLAALPFFYTCWMFRTMVCAQLGYKCMYLLHHALTGAAKYLQARMDGVICVDSSGNALPADEKEKGHKNISFFIPLIYIYIYFFCVFKHCHSALDGHRSDHSRGEKREVQRTCGS